MFLPPISSYSIIQLLQMYQRIKLRPRAIAHHQWNECSLHNAWSKWSISADNVKVRQCQTSPTPFSEQSSPHTFPWSSTIGPVCDYGCVKFRRTLFPCHVVSHTCFPSSKIFLPLPFRSTLVLLVPVAATCLLHLFLRCTDYKASLSLLQVDSSSFIPMSSLSQFRWYQSL